MCDMVTENGIEVINPCKVNGIYGKHSNALLEQHDPADTVVSAGGKIFLEAESQPVTQEVISRWKEITEKIRQKGRGI